MPVGLRERYDAKVERRGPDECWPWTAAKTTGYGYPSQVRPVMRVEGRTVSASRIGWRLHTGESPPRHLYVLHTCDNPACMNPAHWFLGTAADNTADMLAKGRHVAGRRATTADQDQEIRALVASGLSQTKTAERFGVSRIVIARVLAS